MNEGVTLHKTLHKTLDARYAFYNNQRPSGGACRIRVYEAQRASDQRPTVVIASQVKGCGASVTNFAEDIASEVIRMQRARRSLPPGDPHHEVVWVEHYPVGVLASMAKDELFHLVTFRTQPDGQLTDPKWERVSRDYVETTLLRGPLFD